MRPIAQLGGEEPLWIQPAVRKREHELRAGDDLVATLRFQRGSLADAEAEGHHWTFKRQGFWRPRVTVRIPGSEVDVAVFQPHWTGGGVLEFADGRAVRLRSANFRQSEWVWEDKDQPLCGSRAAMASSRRKAPSRSSPAPRSYSMLRS